RKLEDHVKRRTTVAKIRTSPETRGPANVTWPGSAVDPPIGIAQWDKISDRRPAQFVQGGERKSNLRAAAEGSNRNPKRVCRWRGGCDQQGGEHYSGEDGRTLALQKHCSPSNEYVDTHRTVVGCVSQCSDFGLPAWRAGQQPGHAKLIR